MNNWIKITTFSLALCSLMILFGCGGGETTDTPAAEPPAQGNQVEAPPAPAENSGPTLDHSTSPETEWTVVLSQTEGYKVGDNLDIEFTAKVVDANWHLYSSIPSDEMAYTATEFYLFDDEAKDIEKVGGMTENVTPKEEFDEVMKGTVRFFEEKEVTFTQTFKITGPNPAISGEIFGQVCLDPDKGGQCKPLRLPFEYTFSAE